MTQLLAWLLGAGGIGVAVYLLYRVIQNRVDLDETAAALQLERERAAALEKAAEEERSRRAVEFAREASAVDSGAAAAELLRRATRDTDG